MTRPARRQQKNKTGHNIQERLEPKSASLVSLGEKRTKPISLHQFSSLPQIGGPLRTLKTGERVWCSRLRKGGGALTNGEFSVVLWI